MNAFATLRHLTILFAFAAAANSASATDGKKVTRKADGTAAVEQPVKPVRKEVAAFVDPTAPLAELVERLRTERTTH